MPVFTRANAVEMGRRSAAKAAALRAANKERALAPAAAPLQAPLPTALPPPDNYTALRLICVRAQLAQVDRCILAESAGKAPDGQRLNWLAAAQERLAEQERILAGRPLPGSLRPSAQRARVREPVRPVATPLYELVELPRLEPGPASTPGQASTSGQASSPGPEEPPVPSPAPPTPH